MTKLGERLKEGLTEAITMVKLMRENEGLKAHNKELRAELRKCHQMLVNQARTIRKYQEQSDAPTPAPEGS